MENLNKNTYGDFKQYPEKILQFGEGNFLRAFVDWIVDTMNKKADFNGSVVVVQPLANGLAEKMNEQDGLYTLYLNGLKNGTAVKEHSVINSISRGLNPYTQYDEYLKIADNPELRFVISNTTEAGISYDQNDKLEGGCQNSFPGKITALLYRRYKTFNGDKSKGLIIIPCELIDINGTKLKETILKSADNWNLEKGFVEWINEANTFCNTLVDRIVPGYPREKMPEITKELGYVDNFVVEGEQFHLWVIEGPQWVKNEFPADKAGLNVLFVDNMQPYRTRKVRLLNGPHTTMTPVAYLYGIDTVKDAVEHEVVGKFIKDATFEEMIPTLDLPHQELVDFANAVTDRFKNPYIKHFLMSISLNSMSKYETRVLPSVLGYIERKGQLPNRLLFSLASLIEFYKGQRGEEKIALQDNQDVLDLYKELWGSYDGTEAGLKHIVETVLGYKPVWKRDLNEVDGLTAKVTEYLSKIEKLGIKEAIKEVI